MIHLEQGGLNLVGALQRYNLAWSALVSEYQLEDFTEFAKATTVSWKVADKTKLFFNLQSLAEDTEQLHVGTVNNRFIACVVLHKPLEANILILKILERRAGSKDPLGLDSVDYLVPDVEKTYSGLKAAGLYVVKESNDMHSWLSLRFGKDDEFEAKFTDNLVIKVAQDELKLTEEKILKRLGRK